MKTTPEQKERRGRLRQDLEYFGVPIGESRLDSSALFGSWLPIETAPEDGSEVLLYQPDAGMQVSWYGYDPDNEELGWYRFSPTHWMPLPSPPNSQDDAR